MNLDDLVYDVIDEQPRPYDFSTYVGRWDLAFDLTDDELECGRYEPIYNVFYPLSDRFTVPRDVRRRLDNMTVVRIEDAYGLALTGCGMDFTWEICNTYMNLGYYPPTALCRLPAMAGRGSSARDRRIIEACLCSVDSALTREQWTYDYLRRMQQDR